MNNFQDSNEPRALCLPAGTGEKLADVLDRFAEELPSALLGAFEGEDYQARLQTEQETTAQEEQEAVEALQERAKEKNLALLRTPAGFPVHPHQGRRAGTRGRPGGPLRGGEGDPESRHRGHAGGAPGHHSPASQGEAGVPGAGSFSGPGDRQCGGSRSPGGSQGDVQGPKGGPGSPGRHRGRRGREHRAFPVPPDGLPGRRGWPRRRESFLPWGRVSPAGPFPSIPSSAGTRPTWRWITGQSEHAPGRLPGSSNLPEPGWVDRIPAVPGSPCDRLQSDPTRGSSPGEWRLPAGGRPAHPPPAPGLGGPEESLAVEGATYRIAPADAGDGEHRDPGARAGAPERESRAPGQRHDLLSPGCPRSRFPRALQGRGGLR